MKAASQGQLGGQTEHSRVVVAGGPNKLNDVVPKSSPLSVALQLKRKLDPRVNKGCEAFHRLFN